MKTVKALVAFSNGVISMEQYEVRELPADMANDLIAAGICAEISGGSGGLPTPTAEDIGKVATVVGETSKGAVIVPEQSVTVSGEDGAVLSNANISLFTVGTYCTVTINGTDYSGTVEERRETPMLAISLGVGHGEAIFGAINGNLILVAENGTYTVSVNVASTSVSYGLSAPSGGVLVVNATRSGNTMTLTKTWQEIFDAYFAIFSYATGDDDKNVAVIRRIYKDSSYKVETAIGEDTITFSASTASGYPTYSA